MGRRREPVNPFIGVNYIPDARMEAPPAWFLQRFFDFDNYLVIIPSKKVPFAYIIARRRQFSKGLTDKAIESSIDQPDTILCLKHGCVPVCLMYKTGPTWDVDTPLRTLAARDMWKFADESGLAGTRSRADIVADHLEAQEEAEKQKIRAAIRDDLWNRSGDAWRSYQARTGQRTKLSAPKGRKTRREQRKQIAPSTSSSTGASGIVITG